MIWSGLSNIIYWSYHANFIYWTVVEKSIWVLNGLNPQETLRILLCNYYQCSNDSKVLIYHAALPTPSPIYDPTTEFVGTLHFLCTRFYVPGFGLYQVFFYQVFCLFWNVPGFKVPGTYFKKVSGLRYQVGESTRWKVPEPGTFLYNLVKKPMWSSLGLAQHL